jgi:hypothetical protein
MSEDIVLDVRPAGFPWQTDDPFLFCVHHEDAYPRGDERMGPAVVSPSCQDTRALGIRVVRASEMA